ncbi:MAG: hypothetical protein JNL01_04445 [Bdellovibrionales bacterium]|nr:hypothetical protein [Bdellovibrionales bacterium]
MEQNDRVYEYRLNNEVFTFEAPSKEEAEKHRQYAILHFKDTLGTEVSPNQVQGPFLKTPRTQTTGNA